MSIQVETETVDIKVTLDSDWHNEPPKFAVLLDNELIEDGVVIEKNNDNNCGPNEHKEKRAQHFPAEIEGNARQSEQRQPLNLVF